MRSFHDCYKTKSQIILITKENFAPLDGVILSGISAPSQFLTCYSVRPSCPPCQIIPQSQITIVDQLQFEFPLYGKVPKPRTS